MDFLTQNSCGYFDFILEQSAVIGCQLTRSIIQTDSISKSMIITVSMWNSAVILASRSHISRQIR